MLKLVEFEITPEFATSSEYRLGADWKPRLTVAVSTRLLRTFVASTCPSSRAVELAVNPLPRIVSVCGWGGNVEHTSTVGPSKIGLGVVAVGEHGFGEVTLACKTSSGRNAPSE